VSETREGNAPDLYLGGAPFELELHWITFGGVLFSHSTPMSSRTYNKIAPTSFHIP